MLILLQIDARIKKGLLQGRRSLIKVHTARQIDQNGSALFAWESTYFASDHFEEHFLVDIIDTGFCQIYLVFPVEICLECCILRLYTYQATVMPVQILAVVMGNHGRIAIGSSQPAID